VIARTTTTRLAPARSTSSSRSVFSIPPMANHGRAGFDAAVLRISSRPAAGRPGLVGVGQQGPAQK
jgi:hypothetical protein